MSWILDGVCGCSLWKSTIIFYGYEHSMQHQMSPQMAETGVHLSVLHSLKVQ